MKKDTEITKVIFKKARYDDGQTEIVAFFPGVEANPGNIQCYAHMGQHSEASYEFYSKSCRRCSDSEYLDLKRELENIFGYRIKVVHRMTANDRARAWALTKMRRQKGNEK